MFTMNNFQNNYGYKSTDQGASLASRPEYRYFVDLIKPQSKVLDLASGEGSLGKLLIDEKGCEVFGLEIDQKGVDQALAKGVRAKRADIDEGLKEFSDSSFDFVICNVSLQMFYQPGFVLKEMLRVGKEVIVSFPNVGYWKNRLELLGGHFPVFSAYGHLWYETRSIHFFSLADVLDLLKNLKVKVVTKKYLGLDSYHEDKISKVLPNLFATVCILEITKNL